MDMPFQGKRVKGVYRIYNIKTDMSVFGYSDDVAKKCIDERFKLDLGLHENKELQKDYSETGLELFVFECVKETENEDDLEATIDSFKAKGVKLY